MTLSPDDLAAMGERHVKHDGQGDSVDRLLAGYCRDCTRLWPCEVRRLLDEVEALEPYVKELMHLEDVLREITAFPRPWIARDVDVIQSIIDAALNHPPMIGESDAGETAASVRHVGGVPRGEAE